MFGMRFGVTLVILTLVFSKLDMLLHMSESQQLSDADDDSTEAIRQATKGQQLVIAYAKIAELERKNAELERKNAELESMNASDAQLHMKNAELDNMNASKAQMERINAGWRFGGHNGDGANFPLPNFKVAEKLGNCTSKCNVLLRAAHVTMCRNVCDEIPNRCDEIPAWAGSGQDLCEDVWGAVRDACKGYCTNPNRTKVFDSKNDDLCGSMCNLTRDDFNISSA